MKRNLLSLGSFMLLFLTTVFMPAMAQENEPALTTIVLVRHAEKANDGSQDPPLSEKGKERAEALAEMLGNTSIDAVFSSDYLRTRSTAMPLAEQKGLEVQLYDPRRQDVLIEKLQKEYKGKTVVVIGHSNTIPFAVNALLEENRLQTLDEAEYEKVFVVSMAEDGSRSLLPLQLKL